MGLLENIKKENKLKDFILNEFRIIDENIVPNTEFKEKVEQIKELYKQNTLKALKTTKKELKSEIHYSYLIDNKSYEKKLKLKEHLIFEKECIPLIKRHHKELDKIRTLSIKKEEVNKRIKEHGVLHILAYIISPIIFFKYIFSFILNFKDIDSFSSTIMIIVFIFTGVGTLVGYLLIRDYMSLSKFDERIVNHNSIIDDLKTEINKY